MSNHKIEVTLESLEQMTINRKIDKIEPEGPVEFIGIHKYNHYMKAMKESMDAIMAIKRLIIITDVHKHKINQTLELQQSPVNTPTPPAMNERYLKELTDLPNHAVKETLILLDQMPVNTSIHPIGEIWPGQLPDLPDDLVSNFFEMLDQIIPSDKPIYEIEHEAQEDFTEMPIHEIKQTLQFLEQMTGNTPTHEVKSGGKEELADLPDHVIKQTFEILEKFRENIALNEIKTGEQGELTADMVAKYSLDGTLQWLKQIQAKESDQSIETDSELLQQKGAAYSREEFDRLVEARKCYSEEDNETLCTKEKLSTEEDQITMENSSLYDYPVEISLDCHN